MNLEQDLQEQRGRVAKRVKFLRESLKITQAALAKAAGLPSAKALSMGENEDREFSSEEISKISNFFKRPIDFFFDPTLLIGEGVFSWRAVGSSDVLIEFEEVASRWIGAWRNARKQQGEPCAPFSRTIGLDAHSTFREAWTAAELINSEWKLGRFPAERLAQMIERALDVLVLPVDMPPKISGAACWLRDFGTILINRHENEGRRNFDLAHELFHLLTWQAMKPSHIDSFPTDTRSKHVERLADNFAGALLMPEETLRALHAQKGEQTWFEWLADTAPMLKVSAQALYWRLIALRMIRRNHELEGFARASYWDRATIEVPFSTKFIVPLQKSVDEGFMSESYAAKLLGVTREGLSDLFSAYPLAKA